MAQNNITDVYEQLNTTKMNTNPANDFNITWHCSTERSPQHNVHIKRVVQVVKSLLQKILNDKILNETEMYTVLTDCRAASKMRPYA